MSLDDDIHFHDQEAEPMEVCDACDERLRREGPTPIGWKILGFTCTACGKCFCEHLDGGDNVCVDCAAKATTRRRSIGDGSAHWPRVPVDDGTAQVPDRRDVEEAPPGSGPGAIALLVLIAILVLGVAGAMVMISHHAGGAR